MTPFGLVFLSTPGYAQTYKDLLSAFKCYVCIARLKLVQNERSVSSSGNTSFFLIYYLNVQIID